MRTTDIKNQVKQLIKNNSSLKSFSITDNGSEQFTTRNEFGLRLLELIKDSDVVDFQLSTVEREGYYGQSMSFESALKLNDITKIDFRVVRQSNIDTHNQNMANDKGYWLRNGFGTAA